MAIAIVTAALSLADSGIKLTSQILARTSPSEVRKLIKLEESRLEIKHDIAEYMTLKPSERIQSRLENNMKLLGEIIEEISVIQIFANQKLTTMRAAGSSVLL